MLLALFGLNEIVAAVRLFRITPPHADDPPYFAQAFYAASAINLVCVVAVFVAGVYLWRVRRAGRILSNAAFTFELAYFFLDFSVIRLVLRIAGVGVAIGRDAIASVGGIGNMGIGLQIIIGYPLIALVVVNIAYRRLNRTGSEPLQQGKGQQSKPED
jgi:hypothetical protein